MIRKSTYLAVSAMMLLLLASCGSVGDILGGGSSPSSNGTYASDIRGTVDSVDPNSGSIILMNTSGMSSSSGSSVRVYYDNQTTVSYQGQTYRPQDLERGDEVSARVTQSGNRLMAEAVTVTYNANNNNGSSYPNNNYPNNGSYSPTVRGTVASVDTSRRTIQVDRGYGQTMTVDYDPNTSVFFNGRSSYVSDLQRGDQVDISGRDLGSGRILAQRIDVVRSTSSSGTNGTYGNQYATVRGTVRYIDAQRQTMELESTSWITGFVGGGGSSSNVITVQFDANTRVDVQGQMYPVTGLERGDVVEVQVSNPSSSLPFAQRLTLIRNVRG